MLLITTFLFTLIPSSLARPSISPPSAVQLVSSSEFRPNGSEISGGGAEKRQLEEGSSCEGSEGQWNCLTDRWQRCAAGRWSAVVDCAKGTICTPAGLTDDFFVQFAYGAAGGPERSAGVSGRRIGISYWILPWVLGGVGAVNGLY